MSFARPPILDTDACLEFVNSLEYGKEHGPLKNLEECGKAEAVWSCLHEIYPSWFDESLHPSNFATPEEALSQILYYLDEFHENKYAADFKVITDNINHFLSGDPSLILKTYEFLLLATIHGEGQQIIAKIMEMSQSTQTLIQTILQEHADINEKDFAEQIEDSDKTIAKLKEDIEAYMDKIVEAESDSLGAMGLRKQVDSYKEKVADAEERLSTVLAEKDALVKLKEEVEKQVSTIEKKLEVKELEIAQLHATIEAKDFEISNMSEKLKDIDKHQGRDIVGDLEALEREKKKSGAESAAKIVELTNELDDLKRVKQRLEKNNAVYLAQIAVLQKELSTGLNGGVDAQKFQELVTKTAKQEEEIKQLQESKDEMARQMMEALAKRAEGGGTTGGEDKDENAAAALIDNVSHLNKS
ncbi:hook protein, partial [Cystoisospora suis]